MSSVSTYLSKILLRWTVHQLIKSLGSEHKNNLLRPQNRNEKVHTKHSIMSSTILVDHLKLLFGTLDVNVSNATFILSI